MAETTQTREIPALQVRAAFEPSTLNREKRTVEVTWSTGARVLRGFWERFWEELSLDAKHVRLDRLNNGAPYLADHNSYSVAQQPGVVERAWLTKDDAGQPVGRALVRFVKPGVDPEADRLFEKIADGIVLNASVGYRVHKFEKISDAEDGIPVMRAVSWTPHEVSSVTIGADDGAGVRSEATATTTNTNPCEFIITRGEAPQKETKMPDETKPPAPVVDATRTQEQIDAALAARAQLAERERINTVRGLAKAHGMSEEFAQRMVDTNATVDATRAAILDELAKRGEETTIQSNHRITPGEDHRDKQLRGMGAALLARAGASDYFERAAESKKFGKHFKGVDTDGGEFRSYTLLDMARHILESHKRGSTVGLSKMELVKRAIELRSGGMQSTSDFSVLFESALHKMMLAAYALADDTWRRFCGVDSVPDFRASNRYRLGSMGVADDVNESGEFKSKPIPDGSKFQITTGTKGNIIAITRQAIINDDMSALSSVSTQFGRSFGLTIEANVYALLNANSGLGPTQTDSQPFFHANRANVNATGSALSVDALDADRVVMGKQKDPDANEYLNLRPRVLLVPLGLEGTARVLNQSQFDPSVSGKIQIPNKVVGLFQDVVGTPRLTDATRRYLFANDPAAPAIKVVFLEGQGEAPVLESEMGFEVDGMRWRARLDVKAQMFDPKGAVTNAGA